MKRVLAITAILAGLGIAGPRANAQGYIVNGRDATTAEVQLLVSHGARSGSWSVDGYGMSSTGTGQNRQSAARQQRSQVLVRPRRAALRITPMITLLIALGALMVAIAACALVDPQPSPFAFET
jgi:hypothetical protein